MHSCVRADGVCLRLVSSLKGEGDTQRLTDLCRVSVTHEPPASDEPSVRRTHSEWPRRLCCCVHEASARVQRPASPPRVRALVSRAQGVKAAPRLSDQIYCVEMAAVVVGGEEAIVAGAASPRGEAGAWEEEWGRERRVGGGGGYLFTGRR